MNQLNYRTPAGNIRKDEDEKKKSRDSGQPVVYNSIKNYNPPSAANAGSNLRQGTVQLPTPTAAPSVTQALMGMNRGTVQMPKIEAPTVSVTAPKEPAAPTAVQQNLAQVTPKEEKWYKGESPTLPETVARITEMTKNDPAQGKLMFDSLAAMQKDPTNPFYNPYDQPTNKAIKELAALGFDMSGGVTPEWIEKNSWLMQHYRMGNGNSPLAPSKSSTKEQDAAYWYYKILGAEGNTQKMEKERAALQEEIAYWAKRSDRNYSDDEIKAKINWKNYPTLVKMDADKNDGIPMVLNRGTDYSQDMIDGLIWAARNESTGNALADSIQAVLGNGNTWVENKAILAKLDPTSKDYNPYAVGSTEALDDAALYFGVPEFSQAWLDEHVYYMNGDDETAKKYYKKVMAAEAFTQKAETERAALQAEIEKMENRGNRTADQIIRRLESDFSKNYPTLAKMDKSLEEYSPLATTRAIDYKWGDIVSGVNSWQDKQLEKAGSIVFSGMLTGVLGAQNVHTESERAVGAERDKNISDAQDIVDAVGTPEEKVVFGAAYSSDFATCLDEITGAIQNGITEPEKYGKFMLDRTDKFAADNYFSASKKVRAYTDQQKKLDEMEALLQTYQKRMDLGKALAEYAWDYGWDMQEERPTVTQEIDGKQYTFTGEFNQKTGKFEVVSIDMPSGEKTETKETETPYAHTGDIARTVVEEGAYSLSPDQAAIWQEFVDDAQNIDAINSGDEQRIISAAAQWGAARTPQQDDKEEQQETAVPEEVKAAAEEWADSLPDLSAYVDQDNPFQPMSGEEYTQLSYDYNQLIGMVETARGKLATMQKDYDEGQKVLAEIERGYSITEQLYGMNGIAFDNIGSIRPVLEYADILANTPIMQEWPPESAYEMALHSGMEYDQVAEYAVAGQKSYAIEADTIDYMIRRLKEAGAKDSDETVKALTAQKEYWQREEKAADYFLLRGNADFQRVVEDEKGKIKSALDSATMFSLNPGGFDRLDIYAANPALDFDTGGKTTTYMPDLTQEERDTYLYLLGKEGREAAASYYDYMTNDQYGVIHRRNMDRLEAAAQQIAEAAPGFATVGTIIASPAKLLGTAYTAIAWLKGEDPNPYNVAYGPSVATNVIRETEKKNLLAAYGGKDSLGGKTATTLYDVFTNAGDSLMNMAIMGGGVQFAAKEGAGALAKFGVRFAGEMASASPMGLEAATDAVRDVYLRGGTRDQAKAMAAVTFLAETVTEAITVGNIQEAFAKGAEQEVYKSLKELLWGAVKDGMLEEAPGEMINEAVESYFDTAIMGQLSNYEAAVTAYMEDEKMDRLQAEKAAQQDIVHNVLYAGLCGALSGMGMTQFAQICSGQISRSVQLEILAHKTGTNVNELAAQINQQMQAEQEAQDQQAAEEEANQRVNQEMDDMGEQLAQSLQDEANTEPAAEEQQQPVVEEQQPGEEEQQPAAEEQQQPTVEQRQQAALEEWQKQAEQKAKGQAMASAEEWQKQAEQQTEQKAKDLAMAATEEWQKQSEQRAQRVAQLKQELANLREAEARARIRKDLASEQEALAAANKQTEQAEQHKKHIAQLEQELANEQAADQRSLDEANAAAESQTSQANERAQRIAELEQEIANERAADQRVQDEARTAAEEQSRQAEQRARRIAEIEQIIANEQAADQKAKEEAEAAAAAQQQQAQERAAQEARRRQEAAAQAALQMQNANSVASKSLVALFAAMNADVSSQTATIAAVMAQGVTDVQTRALASTAAQHMVARYGGAQAVSMMQNILASAQQAASIDTVMPALVVGSLVNGQTAAVLNTVIQTGQVDAQTLTDLMDSSVQDMQNPDAAAEMNRAVKDNAVAQNVKKGIAEGSLNALQPYQDALEKAQAAEQEARNNLNDAVAAQKASAQNLWKLQAQLAQNPGDAETTAEMNRAVSAFEGAVKVVKEYSQALANKQAATQTAAQNYARTRDQLMSQQRQQAQADVDQAMAQMAEEAARAQEEANNQAALAEEMAQAEDANNREQQDEDNVAAMDAEGFISDRLNNRDLTEDERQELVNMAKRIRREVGEQNMKKRDRFVKQISKKFGIDIVFANPESNSNVNQWNGQYDAKNRRITLNENATTSDAMYFVMGHELTHAAEESGTYNDLAAALLRMRYGAEIGNFDDFIRRMEEGDLSGQAAADVVGMQELYNSRLDQMHEQDSSIDNTPLDLRDAAQEIVADIMGKLLHKDQQLAEQLAKEEPSVARKIINSIKAFLKKMVGIDGQWRSDAQEVVDMLENALKDNKNKTSESRTRYMLVGRDPGTGKQVYISNFEANTPAFDKGRHIVDLIQNIWSKQPIALTVTDANGAKREILAQFDPDIDPKQLDKGTPKNQIRMTDAGKIAFGNKKGNSSDRRVTLNLADDYYEILKSSEYAGDDSDIDNKHNGEVNRWDYFINDIYYADQGSDDATPYRVEIDIKETDDGNFVYTYWAKRQNEQTKKLSLMGIGPVNAGNNVGESASASETMVSQPETDVKPIVKNSSGEVLADELPGGTVARNSSFSLSSWTDEERQRVRNELTKRGFSEESVDKWIANTNSIAAMIAADKERLDFTADPSKTMLKPNAEYVKTLDASTLCAKRLLYQGTFNQIQHALPNTALMPEDLIDLANLMREMGYEVPCGICYVESRRRNLGKFANDWLKDYQGVYKPTLDQVTTTDGLQQLKETHPETYQDFVNAMNKKGTMNPKVVQLRTDYRGEISDMTPGQVQKVKDIGGLRVQSFSDFETPHLLDMMQAVMDMASKELTSQAYTKVPNMPWVFGDTGIKINMSLIGKGTGLDANGNLVFDDVEGMNFNEAMRLRDRYSKNVGTILVGINDAHILAAMADDRIDFIIPFHKSGWSKEELAKMPVLNSYSDYTDSQNEKKIVGRNNKGGYKTESLDKSKRVNFQPVGENGYWDFSKSGKENAETYLRMCAEDGRVPKFSQFLVDNGDGSFSLQPDGSTDGYWKTLIDFKMYDNDGVGSPQKAVMPNVNMEEAMRVLDEYKGGADQLPVAQPVVDRYVEEYKAKNPRIKYSLPSRNILEAQLRNYIANGGALSENTAAPRTGLPGPARQQNQGSRQRQFGSQTAQRSAALHDEVRQYLRENSAYDPDTNRAQINRAIDWVQGHATEYDQNGYFAAVEEAASPDFDYMSADGQARMLTLMSMAAMTGDVQNEVRLADLYNQQGTDIGRALQARQIFAMMTPLGRVGLLNNEVNRVNQQYRRAGRPTRVGLSSDTLEAARRARTREDFNDVQRRARREIADQMPPSWKDKLQGWRMLSMLGNPRTHIRNILGNAIFMPAVRLKNVIGTGLELGLQQGEKTKSLFTSKENRQFARQDARTIKDILTGEAKMNPDSQIQRERKVFGTSNGIISKTFGRALQGLSDFNSKALEAEDWVFLQRHYTNALAGWMQANKLNPDSITPEQLQQGREYAINEAQKATYRDASKIADMFARISRQGGIAGWVVDAAIPFKKTPANILKRGIEYSPVGLIRTLIADSRRLAQYNAWARGELETRPDNAISPSQFIDRIASGLSGTAIAALGALLAHMGVVAVGFDDDDEEFEELKGNQEYSLKLSLFGHDVSYTIDWMAPASMPFFVGASIYNSLAEERDNVDVGSIAESLLEITEPVFNLSMLDGVNSLLNVNNFSGGNAITEIGQKVAANYASSFIPTLAGQISRTIDPVRRKAYVESGASLATWRYAIEQVQNKTPYSVANIPYRNQWGEEDRSSIWMAAFENLISPGYFSEVKETELDKELERLFEATGEKGVVPQLPSKSISINGETIRLNAEQYDQYTTERGKTAKDTITALMGDAAWTLMDDDAKAELVADAFTYANQTARAKLFPEAKKDSWVTKAEKGGDPAKSIYERHEEKQKQAYIAGYQEALVKAVNENDVQSAWTSIEALRQAGKKDSDIKSYVTRKFKPVYQEAYLKDDYRTLTALEDMLMDLDLGYGTKTFSDWMNAADDNE